MACGITFRELDLALAPVGERHEMSQQGQLRVASMHPRCQMPRIQDALNAHEDMDNDGVGAVVNTPHDIKGR